MIQRDDTPSLKARLEALATFLAVFESPDFSFGTWDTSEGHLPYYFASEEASRFVGMAYEYGWCTSDIDWVSWIETDDAQRFADGHEPIAQATVSELEHLLTTFIRQDRFVEGNLAGLYASGHLTATARRADALLREMGN
jgi:hypothetical protein